MREIEFRAFDDERKEMLPSVDIEVLMTKGALVTNYKSFVENIRPYIMQYTGLLDKNGVKIFEGDVVIHYEIPNKAFDIKQEVFFSDGMFCVGKIGETETPLYLETNTAYRGKNVNLIEVVGNKFENPEFLAEVLG